MARDVAKKASSGVISVKPMLTCTSPMPDCAVPTASGMLVAPPGRIDTSAALSGQVFLVPEPSRLPAATGMVSTATPEPPLATVFWARNARLPTVESTLSPIQMSVIAVLPTLALLALAGQDAPSWLAIQTIQELAGSSGIATVPRLSTRLAAFFADQ